MVTGWLLISSSDIQSWHISYGRSVTTFVCKQLSALAEYKFDESKVCRFKKSSNKSKQDKLCLNALTLDNFLMSQFRTQFNLGESRISQVSLGFSDLVLIQVSERMTS